MNKKEIETLTNLLNKYFEEEFIIYKNMYHIAYGENSIQNMKPTNIFIDFINTDHPYGKLLEKMEENIMDHILRVFIIQDEHDRFTKPFDTETDL